MLGQILAHDLPLVLARRVVPGAVDHGHARLLAEAAGGREAVGLGPALGPGFGPLVDPDDEAAVDGPVRGQHLDEGRGPEPAVDVERLVVRGLTPAYLKPGQTVQDKQYYKLIT